MSVGRTPGSGKAQARILAVLRGLGMEPDGRPRSLRSAELSARAKVNHHSLAKCTGALLAAGTITRCLVQPAKGPKTFEFRIGSGMPQDMKPLNTRTAGTARAAMVPPKARAKARPVVRDDDLPAYPATTGATDAAMLERIQAMNETQLGAYIAHLVRVWSWGKRG